MDEDYYALSKLARTVFRTNDLDHRRGGDTGAAEAERHAAANPMAVTYKDVERADGDPRGRSRRRAGGADPAPAPAEGGAAWGEDLGRAPASHAPARRGDPRAVRPGRRGTPARRGRRRDRRRGAGGAARGRRRRGRARRRATRCRRCREGASPMRPGARFQYVTRRANDRGALLAGVHPSLLPGGRSMLEAGEVEQVWGPLMNREPGRDTMGILRACADARDRRAVPDRRRPAARRARRRARAPRARQRAGQDRAVARARVARALRRRVPAGERVPREGRPRLRRGRAAASGCARSAAATASASPTGRSSRAWRWRAAATSGSRRSTSCTRRWARLLGTRETSVPDRRGRRAFGPAPAERPRRRRRRSSCSSPTRCSSTRGGLSEGADELKAALEDEAFVELHPSDAGALGLADGASRGRAHRGRGRPSCRCDVTEHIAPGAAFVPFNQPGLAANTLLSGAMLARATISAADVRRARSGDRRASGGQRREVSPDGLGRLGDPRRAGRDRVLRAADRRDALHLDGAQGDRRHADPGRPDARRPPGRADHARRRHQALLQGRHHADERRPPGLRDRADPRDVPRVPRVLRDPVRHRASRCSVARSRSSSPTSTSASCGSSR